jgi:hypothetical protein
MNKKDLKRFMPVTLFTAVTSGIIYEIGIMVGVWYFKEIAYPFVMYGLLPAGAIWIFRFTYGRFGLYLVTNAIIDLVFAFIVIPWVSRMGLIGMGTWSYVIIYIITFGHACLLYGYQIWQETIFALNTRDRTE